MTILGERRSEFVALIKKDMNFFKHADKDPEEITEFAPITDAASIFPSTGIGVVSTSGSYPTFPR